MRTLIVLVLGFVLCAYTHHGTGELQWLTNFDEAKKAADSSGRVILMSFSGSDWCANCMRLERDLFQQDDFQVFAEENLVLLQLDFPAKKQNKLSKAQTNHNELLAERYNNKGVFPLVLLVNAQGEVLGRMSHPAGNAATYIGNIKTILQN